MAPKERKPLRRIGKKKQAQLDAAGERAYSTIPKRKAGAMGALMQRTSKPIAKVNPDREVKRRKRYAVKLAKYRASDTFKVVELRADGRCEFACNVGAIPDIAARYAGFDGWTRCASSERLEHHHKTYARFGGNELPEDITVVCKPHHDYLESLKPAGNRRSRSRRASPSL